MSHQDSGGLRILVVDDFEMGRFLMKKALGEIGYRSTEEAEDGAVAIDKIREAQKENRPYSIVFCDWTMPEASGLDVLKMIRNTPEISGTPFIMVTATSDRENLIRALDAGVSEYITKPVSPDILVSKIERAMKSMRKLVS